MARNETIPQIVTLHFKMTMLKTDAMPSLMVHICSHGLWKAGQIYHYKFEAWTIQQESVSKKKKEKNKAKPTNQINKHKQLETCYKTQTAGNIL